MSAEPQDRAGHEVIEEALVVAQAEGPPTRCSWRWPIVSSASSRWSSPSWPAAPSSTMAASTGLCASPCRRW
eukprot:13983799-Alexandrium_andersonii.AAC.1